MQGTRFLATALPSAVLLFLVSLGGACQQNAHEWTPEDMKASNSYYTSQRDNREASRIINRAGEVFSIDEREKVIKLTDSALASAQKVPDSFMDKVHPEFKKHYRGEFITALELARRNLEHPDSQSAHRSEKLFSEFVDWFNANRDNIHMPPAY